MNYPGGLSGPVKNKISRGGNEPRQIRLRQTITIWHQGPFRARSTSYILIEDLSLGNQQQAPHIELYERVGAEGVTVDTALGARAQEDELWIRGLGIQRKMFDLLVLTAIWVTNCPRGGKHIVPPDFPVWERRIGRNESSSRRRVARKY